MVPCAASPKGIGCIALGFSEKTNLYLPLSPSSELPYRINARECPMVLFRCSYALLMLGALPCVAQQPLIFDVSTVVVGSQRLETLWAFAEGKWSDAGSDVGINSTDIHCYKRFGFCEVATASPSSRLASV